MSVIHGTLNIKNLTVVDWHVVAKVIDSPRHIYWGVLLYIRRNFIFSRLCLDFHFVFCVTAKLYVRRGVALNICTYRRFKNDSVTFNLLTYRRLLTLLTGWNVTFLRQSTNQSPWWDQWSPILSQLIHHKICVIVLHNVSEYSRSRTKRTWQGIHV